MAVAFRSQSSANTGAAAAASLTINLPASVQVGDMLIAAVTADLGTGVNFSAPAGWTIIVSTTQTTLNRLSTYWRLADGTEPASYTWTFDTAVQASAGIVAYSSAHPFAPMVRGTTGTGTATTTLTPAGINSSYSGFGVQVFATRNTTAAASVTPPGGNNERLETTTTASSFIGLQMQDTPKGFPVGGVSTAVSSATQAITYLTHTFFLSDARPELNIMGIDELTAGSSTGTSITMGYSAFSTNYPNELLILMVAIGKSNETVSSITGGGLTWELVGRANALNGSSEVWRAFAQQRLDRQSISISFSGTIAGGNSMIVGIRGAAGSQNNGADAIGAVATATSSSSPPTVSLTTTKSNAWVWGVGNDPDANTSVTAGSGQTNVRSFGDSTNSVTTWMLRRDELIAAPGSTGTIDVTSPSGNSCNILALEILPARRPHPPAIFFQ